MTDVVTLKLAGPAAATYFDEQLELSRSEFDGALAQELRRVTLSGSVYVAAPASFDGRSQDWSAGWGLRQPSDAYVARAITRWLSDPAFPQRVLAMEDPFAAPNDPAVSRQPHRAVLGKVLRWASAAEPETARDVLRQVAGYPAIGVLAEGRVPSTGELAEADLKALARSTRVVLVRALDDEAFLLRPVGRRSRIVEQLRQSADAKDAS